MAIGLLAFFTVVSFIDTVVAELRGEPALRQALILLGFVLLTALLIRVRRRS
ncbi:MAG TPA: hypothetical protein VFD04_24420 [Actinomycetes bacterium]|jgi:hypothetical protein|nr:hypothetical protein [Actinomycetes bacterium]